MCVGGGGGGSIIVFYLRGSGVRTGRENMMFSLPIPIWTLGLSIVGKGTSNIRLPIYLWNNNEWSEVQPRVATYSERTMQFLCNTNLSSGSGIFPERERR